MSIIYTELLEIWNTYAAKLSSLRDRTQALGEQAAFYRVGIYIFKVNIGNLGARCEICSKLIIMTSEQPGKYQLGRE